MTKSGGVAIAVVDPTTLLGRDVKAVLTERRFPSSKVHLFHTGDGGAGLLAEDDDEATFIAPLTPDALDTSRIAFLCGKPERSARFLATRGDDGCLVIDLSGLRVGGPFAAPGRGLLSPRPPVLLTPDPIASVIDAAVRLLDGLSPVAALTLAIDRPVSELGKAALDEVFQQAISLATFRPMPKEVLGTQAAFNFHLPPDSAAYEARVATDVRALLGRELPISILSARAGVFHGHLVRLEARFDAVAPPEAAVRKALFAKGTGFEETDVENLSGPVESAGRDETLVLRVDATGGSVRLTMASDHLRRGATLGVLLAEQYLEPKGSGLDFQF